MWNFSDYGNKIAVIDKNGNKYTYLQLEVMSRDFYHAVNERCLVFILCDNNLETLYAYVSCINNQIVPLMLDGSMSPHLLKGLLDKYKPRYIWMPKDRQIDGEIVWEKDNYVLKKLNDNYYFDENLALLLSTSGSTGSARLVRLSYKNLLANTKAIIKALEIDCEHRPITMLPFSYTYGLSVINTHLYVGACILLTNESFMTKKFWDYYNQDGGNSISGVSTTFEYMGRLGLFERVDDRLRMITHAGDRLNRELYRKMVEYSKKKNCRFYPMYGQTEATARISIMNEAFTENIIGTIGKGLDGVKLTIQDSKGQIITTPHCEGELVVYGDNVAQGYAFDYSDLKKSDEWNGRLATHDRAYFDENGYYFVTGRDDNYIKINGKRINLTEIEELLYKKSGEVYVVQHVDEKIAVYGKITDDIKAYIKSIVNLSKVVFVNVDKIPLLGNGKKDIKKLRETGDGSSFQE